MNLVNQFRSKIAFQYFFALKVYPLKNIERIFFYKKISNQSMIYYNLIFNVILKYYLNETNLGISILLDYKHIILGIYIYIK
jgi:hypothetical protein